MGTVYMDEGQMPLVWNQWSMILQSFYDEAIKFFTAAGLVLTVNHKM